MKALLLLFCLIHLSIGIHIMITPYLFALAGLKTNIQNLFSCLYLLLLLIACSSRPLLAQETPPEDAGETLILTPEKHPELNQVFYNVKDVTLQKVYDYYCVHHDGIKTEQKSTPAHKPLKKHPMRLRSDRTTLSVNTPTFQKNIEQLLMCLFMAHFFIEITEEDTGTASIHPPLPLFIKTLEKLISQGHGHDTMGTWFPGDIRVSDTCIQSFFFSGFHSVLFGMKAYLDQLRRQGLLIQTANYGLKTFYNLLFVTICFDIINSVETIPATQKKQVTARAMQIAMDNIRKYCPEANFTHGGYFISIFEASKAIHYAAAGADSSCKPSVLTFIMPPIYGITISIVMNIVNQCCLNKCIQNSKQRIKTKIKTLKSNSKPSSYLSRNYFSGKTPEEEQFEEPKQRLFEPTLIYLIRLKCYEKKLRKIAEQALHKQEQNQSRRGYFFSFWKKNDHATQEHRTITKESVSDSE